jgi:hypothetical protein
MTFAVSGFFPGAKSGLGQFAKQFNLVPPVSLRTLAAHTAIAQKYDQMGNYKGMLGPALSDVNADSAITFKRSFCGGDLHFLSNGQTSAGPVYQTRIRYEGAKCLSHPTSPFTSDSVYLIVSVFPFANKAAATTFKIPDGLLDDFEDPQERTDGAQDIWGGSADVGPQPLTITAMVMGSSLLGDSNKVRDAVEKATRAGADAANAAEGQLASPEQLDWFSKASSDIMGKELDALGLTDGVRGRPEYINLRLDNAGNNDFLPSPPLQMQGPIKYNQKVTMYGDGTSYVAYFSVVTEVLTS